MSHRLYHTEAIMLGSRAYGEANRLLYLLTPDLGLVLVAAQGVRQNYSKLRTQLVNYACLRITLVRGRNIWRLIGAEQPGEPVIALDLEQRRWWWRLCHLARRLIHGEAAHPELFERLVSWHQELALLADPLTLRQRALLRHLELLHLLGYVSYNDFVGSEGLADEEQLVQKINQALAHSQL